MNARDALETVQQWIDDATSFVETIDPDDRGGGDRPIANDAFPIDEALGLLSSLLVDSDEDRAVAILGTFADGHEVYGPFGDFDSASAWADGHAPGYSPAWIATLREPTDA